MGPAGDRGWTGRHAGALPYLSIQLSFTIFLGGGLRLLADKYRPSASEPCTLFSAGMIAGEGLAGILIAFLTVFAQRGI